MYVSRHADFFGFYLFFTDLIECNFYKTCFFWNRKPPILRFYCMYFFSIFWWNEKTSQDLQRTAFLGFISKDLWCQVAIKIWILESRQRQPYFNHTFYTSLPVPRWPISFDKIQKLLYIIFIFESYIYNWSILWIDC